MKFIYGTLFINIILLISFELDLCCALKHFWRGRQSYGNLGEPTQSLADVSVPLGQSEDFFVDQKLDHFDLNSNITWKQRYFVNVTNYVRDQGPIFLYLSAESTADPKWMVHGAWTLYAKYHKALMFQLEHRFFGKSKPTPDLSTSNLRYLTTEQAIKDAALFILEMNQMYQIPSTTKWFVFGASYGASLATWLRLKHPGLVYAAIASSGPLKAVIDFSEYLLVVEQSIAESPYGDECVDALAQVFAEVNIGLQSLEGKQHLNETLHLCNPVETDNDVSILFETLASEISFYVQYDNIAPTNITYLCSTMVNQTIGSPLERFSKVNLFYMTVENTTCLDASYQHLIDTLKDTQWPSNDTDSGFRQWIYLTCNEFGFYQTPEKATRLFGNEFSIEFIIETYCSDIFGPNFNRTSLEIGVQLTNNNYGEQHPNTTNVFTVQGLVDPWHVLGLEYSANPNMPIVQLEGCAHCSDFYEPKVNDLPQLQAVRTKINQWIGTI